jgi:hypothetical protein
MDDLWVSLRLLALLAAANIAPIAAKRLLGARWSAAVVVAAVAAVPLGFPPRLGAEIGALAMLGDMLASFVKRRLRIPSSGRATGIDQIPEALLPLLIIRGELGLAWLQIAAITLAFFALELPLSRLGFWLGLRDRPY